MALSENFRRRAAERATDRGLDRLAAGRVVEDDPLLVAADRARRDLSVQVPEATERRHLAMLRDALALAPAPRRGERRVGAPRRSRRLAIALVAAIVTTLFGAQLAFASGDAIPGDALYPVKRAVERLNLALHPGSDARLHAEFAARRLQELTELLERNRLRFVEQTLTALEREAEAVEADVTLRGVERRLEALREHVQERISQHLERLRYLRDNVLPEAAHPGISRAIERADNAIEKVFQGRAKQLERGSRARGRGGR